MVRFVLPVEKLAVVVPVPAGPMMLRGPSFSKDWLPTTWTASVETVVPVRVQLLDVVPVAAVKLLVALTKICPRFFSVSELVYWVVLLSAIVHVVVPLPVAWRSAPGMVIVLSLAR